MRAILCLVSFCLLTAATVLAQPGGGVGAPPVPNCNGTKAVNEKCMGGIPPAGYIESATCQAKYEGNAGCKKAIAFAKNDYTCSLPISEPGPPPLYTTYCHDTSTVIECAHLRSCLGMTEEVDGVIYTTCVQLGEPTVTWSYKKHTASSTTTPPGCTATFVSP